MSLSKQILKWLLSSKPKPKTKAAQKAQMARQRAASGLLDESDYDFWLEQQAKSAPKPKPAPEPAPMEPELPASRKMTREERFDELRQELKDKAKAEKEAREAKKPKKRPVDVTKREAPSTGGKVRVARPGSKKIAQDVRKFLTEGEFRLKNQRDIDDFLERTGIIYQSEPRFGGRMIEAARREPKKLRKMQRQRERRGSLGMGPAEEEHMTAVKREFYTEVLSSNPDMNKAASLLDELNPEFREQVKRLVYEGK